MLRTAGVENAINLLSHDGEDFDEDSVKFVITAPCAALRKTREPPTERDLIQFVATIKHNLNIIQNV